MHAIKTEQACYVTVPAEDCILWTEGISTCLCIMIKGTIAGKQYLSMYHWEGFPKGVCSELPEFRQACANIVLNIFQNFKLNIRTTMHSQEIPEMKYFFCLGGEEATQNTSGTMREILALKFFGEDAIRKNFALHPTIAFLYVNCLTGDLPNRSQPWSGNINLDKRTIFFNQTIKQGYGDESLKITFSKDEVSWHDDRDDDRDDEAQYSSRK